MTSLLDSEFGCVCTDELLMLLSSEILVGFEIGGGARALKTQQEQTVITMTTATS